MSGHNIRKDSLQRFVFEKFPVRGEIIHLDRSWQTVLERRAYPAHLLKLLGEAMAATVLLTATVNGALAKKSSLDEHQTPGMLTLQLQSKQGPLRLLLVQCSGQEQDANAHQIRGLARWQEQEPIIDEQGLSELCAGGTLVITIDPGANHDRYQGIVAVEEDTLSAVLERYFERSEQLPTRLYLVADENGAAGLLLQRMPGTSSDLDAWNRVQRLAETVSGEELLQVDAETMLKRLFHQEELRLFAAQPVAFSCTCSRGRISTMLLSLGYPEVHDILQKEQQVEVKCEFCGIDYRFDAVDVEAVFAAYAQPTVPETRH